jgi:uncharacterized cupredoxin-like copper-binding protein
MFKNFQHGSFKLALVLAGIGLVLAACSGGAGAAGQPVTVQVTLTSFAINSSLTTFSVGVPYHFVVTNKADVNHEFYIMPPVSDASQVDAMKKQAVGGISGDQLTPGTTKTLDVTFTKPAPAGTLEFACHLPGHYEAGMRLPIVVK